MLYIFAIYFGDCPFNAFKIEQQDAEKCDTVYVELIERKTKITIVIIYRLLKLQAADVTGLYEKIESIIKNEKRIIIGDFNCPSIDWATVNEDQEGDRFFNQTKKRKRKRKKNHEEELTPSLKKKKKLWTK